MPGRGASSRPSKVPRYRRISGRRTRWWNGGFCSFVRLGFSDRSLPSVSHNRCMRCCRFPARIRSVLLADKPVSLPWLGHWSPPSACHFWRVCWWWLPHRLQPPSRRELWRKLLSEYWGSRCPLGWCLPDHWNGFVRRCQIQRSPCFCPCRRCGWVPRPEWWVAGYFQW